MSRTPRLIAGRTVRATAVAAAIVTALGLSTSAHAATPPSGSPTGNAVDTHRAAHTKADTRAALEQFQRTHGLRATGTYDRATNTELQQASPSELSAIYPATQSSATLTGQQCTNARTVIGVGKGHSIPARGIEIALMTAMQESKFVNYTSAVDHDSLGIFQQRPSTGWGMPSQITNVVLSTQSFYGVATFGSNAGLIQIPNWQTRDMGEVAQAVQVSAYPDAYDQWHDWAVNFYNAQAGSVGAISGDSGSASACSGGGGGSTGTRYYVDTFANASVYASPTSTTATGTLYGGTNYVYCKAAGRTISSGSSHNHYWLKTDPDQGPANQWVSAYYLSRWGNDEAKDNSGRVIPDC